ncbi:MAG: YkgJ family cysteine cluster protein [Bacteroidota bacterium]
MNEDFSGYYNEYYRLREEIDGICKRLNDIHVHHLQCKKGCCKCCLPFSILPVEFHAIREELASLNISFLNIRNKKKCIFLQDGLCTIYNYRPIICRTHGLPLLYVNEDDNWELYVCDLNFTRVNLETFTDENTFPQDLYNSKMYMLNQEFIRHYSKKNYSERQLVPVKNIPV